MKTATFDVGKSVDATNFVKSIETYVSYIGRSGRGNPNELRRILNGDATALPTIKTPTVPTKVEMTADEVDILRSIYLEDRKQAIKDQKKLDNELGQLYDEVWEQCSVELKAKLKGEQGFSAMDTAPNSLELRNRIKKMCCGFEAHKMKFYALTQAIKKLVMFYQRPNMSNEEYSRQFQALWDTVVQFGGDIANHPTLIANRAKEIAADNNRTLGIANQSDTKEATTDVENGLKACFMLGGANKEKHKDLKDYLENEYTMNQDDDKYPRTIQSLLDKMNNFRSAGKATKWTNKKQLQRDNDDGLAFVQEGEEDEECGDVAEEQGANVAQQGGASGWKKAKPTS